jgi:hypothetical protein
LLWFAKKAFINVYRVPFISGQPDPIPGAMSNVLAAVIWGIALGYILKKLDPEVEEHQEY